MFFIDVSDKDAKEILNETIMQLRGEEVIIHKTHVSNGTAPEYSFSRQGFDYAIKGEGWMRIAEKDTKITTTITSAQHPILFERLFNVICQLESDQKKDTSIVKKFVSRVLKS
jgi:hypothetical protein